MKLKTDTIIFMHFAYALILVLLIVFVGCSSNKVQPSMEDQQFQKMMGTWKASSVQVDGADITDQYTDFTVTFFKNGNTKEMVATNPGYAFFSGTDVLVFAASSNGSRIIRSSDGIAMTIQASQGNLTLTFNVPVTSTGGRVSGMNGNFTFNLVRK